MADLSIVLLIFRALKRVQALVAEYEKAKRDEKELRAKYKVERDELEEEIARLEARVHASPEQTSEETEKMKQLDEQYQNMTERLQNQRLAMVNFLVSIEQASCMIFQAKKLRDISIINRKIDDIPTSDELAQYRQAFFQLYNQSAVLYRQTKQNYTLYNTFTDMIDYMSKEINLIESINGGYTQ